MDENFHESEASNYKKLHVYLFKSDSQILR